MSDRPSLESLLQSDDFVRRHIGPDDVEITTMLKEVGVSSLDDLLYRAVPDGIRVNGEIDLDPPLSEAITIARLREIAAKNTVVTSLIGQGYYGTVTPAVIQRNVLENPGWYTAYTPYQPEISQGRLEAVLNFQTMVGDLTGMDLANASLLDEATAAAEAMTMARRIAKHSSDTFFVDRDCHPQTIAVLETRAAPLGLKVVVGDPLRELGGADVFGCLLQYPGSSGAVVDFAGVAAEVKEAGGIVAVASDLLALTLMRPPGEWGADIVVGSSQRFGVPLGFGGPHAAFLATGEQHKRTIPGRLVGVSKDMEGRPALRLALQTREQHIRREKATSNICTAQVLLAVMAGLYGTYHGADGLRTIATRVQRLTAVLAEGLRGAGFALNDTFFDTLTVSVADPDAIHAAALAKGINLRNVDTATVGISLDERSTPALVAILFEVFGVEASVPTLDASAPSGIPSSFERTSPFMDHPVFESYHSETEMLRYLRKLQGRDIALDRSMIPLGSCTMKLNGTTEMLPITWPEFADIHPFVPRDQATGYLELIDELEGWLAEITGYDAVSMQPNAGSQGEYAGLLAIRAYHRSRDEGHRNVCLIPASAHGTNPASAAMAGMRVVVVATDDKGNIDVEDLKSKATEHAANLAALMITYPSTHGVFEANVVEVCDTIHEHGGQVYLDGANLNAMVGIAKPGVFGSDVSHLNLHKTFCIPHGGGGPGVGPIGVRAHLAPFLPGSYSAEDPPPVAAAPFGSAGILPISWAYIALMGAEGLTRATAVALLSANYLAKKLAPHFPVLYSGEMGFVAHECILDLRPLHHETGIGVDDVARRLMDYGFHAPTMSFPVPGTLMIEPTESESLVELDRFVDAMVRIREEIADIAAGNVALEDSALHNSPHTAADVTADEWDRPYSREMAAYPTPGLLDDKYWPPVGRIDQQFGDRNLVCACPPIEDYQD